MADRRLNSFFEFNDDGRIRRYNAGTCAHGGEIIIAAPGVVWDFCMKCMKPICLKCAGEMAALQGECLAFERQLRMMEATRLPRIDREKAFILGQHRDHAEKARQAEEQEWTRRMLFERAQER